MYVHSDETFWNITFLQALEEKKQQCQEKLTQAQNILPTILPYTSPASQDNMRENLSALQREVDSLSEQLAQERHDVEKSISDWSEYDACLSRVNQWLSIVDEAVDEAMELRDTLDDKVKHLDHAKVEHDDDTNVCKKKNN